MLLYFCLLTSLYAVLDFFVPPFKLGLLFVNKLQKILFQLYLIHVVNSLWCQKHHLIYEHQWLKGHSFP